MQLVVEPDGGRRRAKEMVVLGESPPDPPWVSLDLTAAAAARNAERLEGETARIEHPQDVVIRRDEERGGVRERRVLREQLRVDVAVRADERKGLRLGVQIARDPADGRVGVEETIFVKTERLCQADGVQLGSYVRDQDFIASASPTM